MRVGWVGIIVRLCKFLSVARDFEEKATGMGRHSKLEGLPSYHDFSSVSVECAALGRSASLGSLAVPSGWPTANATSETGPSATEAAGAARSRWLTFQEGLKDLMSASRATFHDDQQASVE
ncbi:hypothetical protein MSG_03248 [Mycobacterium shigaense]|uniref:Uncharacterized protein n=2 Tax=Mycobacterium shigaense TaxID=722731 RepID=A0A1Z4EKD9_9MYCO|nr:hypothetical protein B2J96_07435 [Mycobacterium shigaense]BAX93386.1 hypothetical protein MSG_03248 [Mycobacterium shigaense]